VKLVRHKLLFDANVVDASVYDEVPSVMVYDGDVVGIDEVTVIEPVQVMTTLNVIGVGVAVAPATVAETLIL